MLPSGLLRLGFITLVSLSLSGCLVTRNQFDALQVRVKSQEGKVAELERRIVTLETRLENFKGVYDKETDALRKRLAELAADLADLQRGVGQIQGRHEELEFKLREMTRNVKGLQGLVEDRFGIDSEVLPEQMPEDAEAFYKVGDESFRSGLTRKARAVFREFGRRYPSHDLTDDALFMVGESLLAEGRFTESVKVYRQVYEQYPNGDKALDAAMKVGVAYVRSNNCKKAIRIYEFVAEQFPATPQGKDARKEVRELKKACK